MPSTVLHKRSSVAGHTPPLASLSAGELAINVHDGKLFVRTTQNKVKSFINDEEQPFVLNTSLSATYPQYGGNTTTQVFAAVLGGYNNDVSGAGATVVNGEDNDTAGDFSFIGTGINNKISIDGDYSFNAAGQNNQINHSNVYTLGSNLTSHASDFTYVNNLSATNTIYGDGSGILNVSAPNVVALVSNAESVDLVRGNVVSSFGAHGDVMSVKLASNSSEATSSKTLGIVNETIPPNGTGYVTINGSMDKLTLAGFAPGDALWLGSSPGTFTNVKPTAPSHGVYLGVAERVNVGNSIAYIKVQNGYELNEIHDVLVTSISAGQILRRNSTNTLWENVNDAEKWDSVFTTVSANSASWVGGSSADTEVRSLTSNWESTYTTVQTNSASWGSEEGSGIDTEVRALTSNWDSTYTTVQTNSANWDSAYTFVTSNSADLTVTGTVSAKYFQGTLIDWMTLVKGYKTPPTLLTTIGTGEVYTYVYATTGSDITYYRYVATNGSEDSFYGNFSNPTLSNLIATRAIIL